MNFRQSVALLVAVFATGMLAGVLVANATADDITIPAGGVRVGAGVTDTPDTTRYVPPTTDPTDGYPYDWKEGNLSPAIQTAALDESWTPTNKAKMCDALDGLGMDVVLSMFESEGEGKFTPSIIEGYLDEHC